MPEQWYFNPWNAKYISSRCQWRDILVQLFRVHRLPNPQKKCKRHLGHRWCANLSKPTEHCLLRLTFRTKVRTENRIHKGHRLWLPGKGDDKIQQSTKHQHNMVIAILVHHLHNCLYCCLPGFQAEKGATGTRGDHFLQDIQKHVAARGHSKRRISQRKDGC